jgi:hypothetical protein
MRVGLLALALAFSAFGCGSSENKKYQFELNGCNTSEHAFDSQQAYCDGLRSNSLNNGCAESMRQSAYERDCGQTFSPTS